MNPQNVIISPDIMFWNVLVNPNIFIRCLIDPIKISPFYPDLLNFRTLKALGAEIVDNWCNTIHMRSCDQLDSDKIDYHQKAK